MLATRRRLHRPRVRQAVQVLAAKDAGDRAVTNSQITTPDSVGATYCNSTARHWARPRCRPTHNGLPRIVLDAIPDAAFDDRSQNGIGELGRHQPCLRPSRAHRHYVQPAPLERTTTDRIGGRAGVRDVLAPADSTPRRRYRARSGDVDRVDVRRSSSSREALPCPTPDRHARAHCEVSARAGCHPLSDSLRRQRLSTTPVRGHSLILVARVMT